MTPAELLARAKEELTRNPRQALQWGLQAWEEMGTTSSPGQIAECRLCLGNAHYFLSQAAEAVVEYGEALAVAREAGITAVQIGAYLGLGTSYRLLGRNDSALDHLGQAWKLAEAHNDELGEMQASIAIGEVYLALERPHEALDYFFRARTRVQGSPRRAELIEILLSLGQTFQTLKRNDEALEQLSRALVLAKEAGNRVSESRALNLIGLLYRDAGELDISEEYYLECLKICQTIDHPWGQLNAYFNLGDLHALRGFRDVAFKHFEKCAALATALEAQSERVKIDLRLAELWEGTGDLSKALEATRRALALERALTAEEASRNLHTLLDHLHAEQSRAQAELLRVRSEKLEAEGKELKKALDSLRVIAELGRRITSSLTIAGLFQTLYESLVQLFELPAVGLALFDSRDDTMRYPLRMENGKRIASLGRRPVGNSLSGWSLRNRATTLISDIEKEAERYLDHTAAQEHIRAQTFRSAVFLPLYAGEDPIGVFTIQSPRVGAYDEVHSRFLETLGGFIVVALRNALSHRKVRRLNRQILRLAHYDPLTGLANRRLLADYLKRTIALAQRRKQKFALFFLDLDGFKPINDEWGHEAGDRVLADLGKRLSGVLRDSDLVARVGGDEFVALALGVDSRESIEAIADKLEEAVTLPFLWEEREIHLGASIGISVYPDSATDADSLMSRADSAMYRIKRSGKNAWGFDEDPS
jgi:diguanylate cyclase (GGDEF)-like protein